MSSYLLIHNIVTYSSSFPVHCTPFLIRLNIDITHLSVQVSMIAKHKLCSH